VFVCVLVSVQFCEFMIYVIVLHCGVLILILQFVGRVLDDVVAHCVLVVAFM